MNEQEQITHLSNEINKVISRFAAEYSMTIASIVGVLEVTKAVVIQRGMEYQDE